MILVTGANGQLGRCFVQAAAEFPALTLEFADSAQLDIANRKAVLARLNKSHIRYVINCAAYTAVDKAEAEPEKARQVNVSGVKNLADGCASCGARLIHFSTDYVYHSRQNTPFREDDPVSPKGVYARTKLAGERAAMKANPGNTMIIRTSWVYAREGHNFVNTMLRLANDRLEVRVVADQIGTPTYAPDLAHAVLKIIADAERGLVAPDFLAGVYHYSNEGVASWYDFAAAVFEIKGLFCQAVPIETRDFPTPALRPPFSLMNKARIRQAFQLKIPHWRDSLKTCLLEG